MCVTYQTAWIISNALTWIDVLSVKTDRRGSCSSEWNLLLLPVTIHARQDISILSIMYQ